MLLDFIKPRPTPLPAELALLLAPRVPDAVDVAAAVGAVTTAFVEKHPSAGVDAAAVVVDATTGLHVMAGRTVEATNFGGGGKERDELLFTFITLLTFDAETVVLGTAVSIPVDTSMADDVPDVITDGTATAAAIDDCKPATDIDVGADANIIDFAAEAGNPPLTPTAPKARAPEIRLVVHCDTGSDDCGIITARDVASPVTVSVAVVVVAVVLLLLLFEREVVNADWENMGNVAEPQRDRKTDCDAATAAVLRPAVATADVMYTGGMKGDGGGRHVLFVLLLPATTLLVVELPQGLGTRRVTGVVVAGVGIVAVVIIGLAMESGDLGFEANGRLVIIAAVAVGPVFVEALVVMIPLASGLDMADDNKVADLGFDALVSPAVPFVVVDFVAVPFVVTDWSATKAAVVDAVRPAAAVFATIGVTV